MVDYARVAQMLVEVVDHANDPLDKIIKKTSEIPKKVKLEVGSSGGLSKDLSKSMDGVLGSLDKINKMAGRQIFDTTKIKQAQGPLNSIFKGIEKINTPASGGKSGIFSFGKDVKMSMEDAAKATGAFGNDAAALGEDAIAAGSKLGSLGGMAEALGVSVMTGAVAGVLALTAAMVASIPVAAAWQEKMTDIGYIIGDAGTKLGDLSDKILEVSAASGVNKDAVAGATKSLLQQGYATDEATKYADGLSKYAQLTGENASSAATSIGNMMRAFAIPKENIGNVESMLVGMQKFSTVDTSLLEHNLERLKQRTQGVKYELTDIAPLMDTLLQQGGSTGSEGGGASGLTSLIQNLSAINPTRNVTDVIQEKLDAIKNTPKERQIALAKNFGAKDDNAANAWVTLANNQTQTQKQAANVKSAYASGDEVRKKFESTQGEFNVKTAKLWNQISISMTNFGTIALPILGAVVDFLTGMISLFTTIGKVIYIALVLPSTIFTRSIKMAYDYITNLLGLSKPISDLFGWVGGGSDAQNKDGTQKDAIDLTTTEGLAKATDGFTSWIDNVLPAGGEETEDKDKTKTLADASPMDKKQLSTSDTIAESVDSNNRTTLWIKDWLQKAWDVFGSIKTSIYNVWKYFTGGMPKDAKDRTLIGDFLQSLGHSGIPGTGAALGLLPSGYDTAPGLGVGGSQYTAAQQALIDSYKDPNQQNGVKTGIANGDIDKNGIARGAPGFTDPANNKSLISTSNATPNSNGAITHTSGIASVSAAYLANADITVPNQPGQTQNGGIVKTGSGGPAMIHATPFGQTIVNPMGDSTSSLIDNQNAIQLNGKKLTGAYNVPKAKSGAEILKEGLVYGHEKEPIISAKIAQSSQLQETLANIAQGGGSKSGNTYNANFYIDNRGSTVPLSMNDPVLVKLKREIKGWVNESPRSAIGF
jgi:TP901 family phage tail tape measure protein